MRAVIDTNVIVSGILNPHGPPGRILDGFLSGTLTLLYDDRTLSEYREVLLRPRFNFPRSDVEVLLDFMEATGEYVNCTSVSARAVPLAGPGSIALILPDPSDLPVLEVAISGHADVLITGNSRHFKPRRGQHGVLISTPADFLRRHGK